VARNSIINLIRHQHVVSESEPTLLSLNESTEMNLSTEFQDERLKLLFVCAHPAIDPAMRTPLMLQTVLGLDAARIAGAFLISPKTMGQRLVRAKIKIRGGGIRFEIPDQRDLSTRLEAVLEAIYAALGIGWDDMAGMRPDRLGSHRRLLPASRPNLANARAADRVAAALTEATGPEAGVAVLDGLKSEAILSYQPYWAVRAHPLQLLDKTSEALEAYDRAIGLAEDPAVREFLGRKRGRIFLHPPCRNPSICPVTNIEAA
jgi:predicted RNA polymerase sigma factor